MIIQRGPKGLCVCERLEVSRKHADAYITQIEHDLYSSHLPNHHHTIAFALAMEWNKPVVGRTMSYVSYTFFQPHSFELAIDDW